MMSGQMMGLGTGLGMLLWAIIWAGITFFIVYEAVYLATRRTLHEIWGSGSRHLRHPELTCLSSPGRSRRATVAAVLHMGLMSVEFVAGKSGNNG